MSLLFIHFFKLDENSLTRSIVVAISAVLDEVMAGPRYNITVEFKVYITVGCVQTHIAFFPHVTIDQCLPIQNS